MAHHYHIVRAMNYGGEHLHHYYGPGLPLESARLDAQEIAKVQRFNQLAGGVWSDAPDGDTYNADLTGEYQYLYIDPCDNEMDFDIPWNVYREGSPTYEFRRAPKGKPCPSLIKKEAWAFFSATTHSNGTPRQVTAHYSEQLKTKRVGE